MFPCSSIPRRKRQRASWQWTEAFSTTKDDLLDLLQQRSLCKHRSFFSIIIVTFHCQMFRSKNEEKKLFFPRALTSINFWTPGKIKIEGDLMYVHRGDFTETRLCQGSLGNRKKNNSDFKSNNNKTREKSVIFPLPTSGNGAGKFSPFKLYHQCNQYWDEEWELWQRTFLFEHFRILFLHPQRYNEEYLAQTPSINCWHPFWCAQHFLARWRSENNRGTTIWNVIVWIRIYL